MNTAKVLLIAMLVSLVGAVGCVPQNGRWRYPVDDGLTVETIRLDYANAHLVRQGGHAFLVDTGLPESWPILARELRAAGVEPGSLRAVIVTHGHADHAGSVARFAELGVPIVAGAGDRRLLEEGHNDELCPTDDTARGRLESDQAATYPPRTADLYVDSPTDLAPLTGMPGRIVPLPGHTAGSLVVTVGDAVLVGDLVRGEILSNGADVHFYQCDLADNRADLERLLDELAPHARMVFVGHFGPVTPAHIRGLLNERW